MNASLEVKSPTIGKVASNKSKLGAQMSRTSLLLLVLVAAYFINAKVS